jgi:hypothetical protein
VQNAFVFAAFEEIENSVVLLIPAKELTPDSHRVLRFWVEHGHYSPEAAERDTPIPDDLAEEEKRLTGVLVGDSLKMLDAPWSAYIVSKRYDVPNHTCFYWIYMT